jgi:3-ketoacyl-CoA synthase
VSFAHGIHDILLHFSASTKNRRSKYQLQHVVRTNLAASDAAYGCVFETEDEQGVRGVKLSKELMSVAGKATVFSIGLAKAVTGVEAYI